MVAEVYLAERCGSQLADALSGRVAYQELLFPGGSMEAVLPVYEETANAAFYNQCVVAAVKAIKDQKYRWAIKVSYRFQKVLDQ